MKGAARKLWLAECRPAVHRRSASNADGAPDVVRLESGRSREALVAHLLDDIARDPRVVIGLDFSFSLPAWFLASLGVSDIESAWALVARERERWLADCPAPFWGRPGRKRPTLPHEADHWRRTERELPSVAGIRPKSTLQIGGAGAVGTGALRGMPYLRSLREAGCAIWPFDAPRFPLIVEIYPRLLTGPVAKSDSAARAAHLALHLPALMRETLQAAAGSDDAFDAVCSAAAMARVADVFSTLPPARDSVSRLEGEIWWPGQR